MKPVIMWSIAAIAVIVIYWIVKKTSWYKTLSKSARSWAGYTLNISKILSVVLTFLVIVAFGMGAGLTLASPEQPESTFLSRFYDATIDGVQTVIHIMEGETDALRAGYPKLGAITWALCFGIPVLTVMTALFVLIACFPHPMRSKEEYLIFSQVEENSILLAEDMMFEQINGKEILRANRKVIFLRVKEDELSPEFAARLKRIKARAHPYTEGDLLRIHWRMRRKKLRFFFLSSNTDLNFEQMKTLLTQVEKEKLFPILSADAAKELEKDEQDGVYSQELYLLSETDSAPLLIDNLRKELCQPLAKKSEPYVRLPVFAHTDLRLLDRYRTVMYDLMEKKALYETAPDREIRILILGFGRVGKAFFRTAASFCAMAKYKTSFMIWDKDIDRQWQELLLEYPKCGEDIAFEKESKNVMSGEVLEEIEQKIKCGKPYTYILLSLGDDERNITVASRLVRHYLKGRWEEPSLRLPAICVNLENSTKSDYVSSLFQQDAPDLLHVFGTDRKTFSESMLINRRLWRSARMLHRGMREEETSDFSCWSEYERRSSVASVAHAVYHVEAIKSYSSNQNYDKAYKKLNKEQKKAMIEAEHRRWWNYSRSEGMQEIDITVAQKLLKSKRSHVDTVAKLTPCMIEFSKLDELFEKLYPKNAKLPEGVQRPKRSFYEKDRYVVSNAGRLHQILQNGEDGVCLKEYEKDESPAAPLCEKQSL